MRKKRPQVLSGNTEKITTGCGSLYLTINEDEDRNPFEIRLQMGKSGSCVRSHLEFEGILLSIILQEVEHERFVKILKKHMRGVSCGQEFREEDKRYSSCIDKIAERLLVMLKEE